VKILAPSESGTGLWSSPIGQKSWDRIGRVLPLLGLVAIVPILMAIYYLGYWLRFEGQIGPAEWERFAGTVAWVVTVKTVFFWRFRVCRGWSRLVTFYDLVTLIQASTAGLLGIILVDRLFLNGPAIPRSVYLLDWGGPLVVLGGVRSAMRGFREWNGFWFLASGQTPVFIVGAGEAGGLVLRAVLRHAGLNYRVIGFIDDDPHRLGMRVDGVPVIGTLAQIPELARRYLVQQILVLQEELSGRQLRWLVEQSRQLDVEVKVLPSYCQLIEGRMTMRPRSVSIRDLLHREPVHLEMENLRKWIDHRVLLVTGSAGSIGSEICRQLLQFSPRRLVLVDRSENGQFFLGREIRELARGIDVDVCIADVLDKVRMQGIFEQHQPDIVFHAAAYKHVPLMEEHPGEAVKNIVVATRRLADVAQECGVEAFVMISTDKAVNPTSVMGTCKRIAELYVQSLAEESSCQFVTVRFGNVLDSAGSVVPIFREQILRGGPVTVTHPDIERYFMTIPEAARLVIQAGIIGNGGQILTLDMGEPVRIVDLANDMIRLSGLRPGEDISVEFSGLRPGEKLYEELLANGERLVPTRHPKIAVAEHRRCNREAIHRSIRELEQNVHAAEAEILERLHAAVPEYRGSMGRPVVQPRVAA